MKQKRINFLKIGILFAVLACICMCFLACKKNKEKKKITSSVIKAEQEEDVSNDAKKLPDGMIQDLLNGREITYCNQKDAQWRDIPYGQSTVGESGCGPTSMAICISTLTGKKVTPKETAQWAKKNGYYIHNAGSKHSLMKALAEKYHLKCRGARRSDIEVAKALKEGKMVVALMGRGHFAKEGHFVVLTGYKDGKVSVADCDSRKRTKRIWDLNLIWEEARSTATAGGPFWVISK